MDARGEVAKYGRSVREETIAACNSSFSTLRWLSSSLVSSITFTVSTFTAGTQTRIGLAAMLNSTRHFKYAGPCVHREIHHSFNRNKI